MLGVLAPPRRSRPRPSGSPRPWSTTACSLDAGWTASAATTAIWRAVLADPGYVVLDQYLGQDGSIGAITYQPGDTLTVVDPGTGRQEPKVIAGILADLTAFDGLTGGGEFGSLVLMAADVFAGEFGARVALGGAAGAGARRLGPGGRRRPPGRVPGPGAGRHPHPARGRVGLRRQPVLLPAPPGLPGPGAGGRRGHLGVVMVRAVRERRRTVGVLRPRLPGPGGPAGVPAGELVRGWRASCSAPPCRSSPATCCSATTTTSRGRACRSPIPWRSISVLVAATAAASLAATAWPARQASRIEPAVACGSPTSGRCPAGRPRPR